MFFDTFTEPIILNIDKYFSTMMHKTPNTAMKSNTEMVKTLKERCMEDMLQHLLLLAGDRFSLIERQVLNEVLARNKTFREVARSLGQNADRQELIFSRAFEKLIHAIEEATSKLLGYEKIEKELNELKAAQHSLKEKMSLRNKFSPAQRKVLDMSIDATELSARVKTICSHGGIRLVSDLVALTRGELRKLRNCGETSAEEVENFLNKHGLTWGLQV